MVSFYSIDISYVKLNYDDLTRPTSHSNIMPNLSYCPCLVITKSEKEALVNMQAYREKYGI